jgi:GNAT superfamily N-acetyltransferase
MARLDRDDPARAGLFGLWVDPAARAAGVGRALTEAVIAWAGAKSALADPLGGRDQRSGFVETNDTMPMPAAARTNGDADVA